MVSNLRRAQAKPGEVRNPKGNPNIGEISKKKSTGPQTDEGKLKLIMSQDMLGSGKYSKVMKKLSHCDKCPLGPTKKIVNDRVINISATCKFYKPAGECVYPIETFTAMIKEHYKQRNNPQVMEHIVKSIAMDARADAGMSKRIETMKKGHPGFSTNMHEERALKAVEVYAKLTQPQINKHQHLHVGTKGDMASEIINKVFEEREEPRPIKKVEEVKDDTKE